MNNLHDLGPLFQWASNQEARRPIPGILRRIARRCRISPSHARVVSQLAGIAPEVWQ